MSYSEFADRLHAWVREVRAQDEAAVRGGNPPDMETYRSLTSRIGAFDEFEQAITDTLHIMVEFGKYEGVR